MKLIICLILLTTSQFTFAETKITKSELICVARSVYYEARSLDKKHWLKIANVAYNRKLYFATYNYGAKSSHLCDIVKSKEYHTNKKLDSKLQEPEVYSKILHVLQTENWYTVTKAVYFSTTDNYINYRTTWRNW